MIIDRNVIGLPVYDCDGHELGTVKDVDSVGSALKVNAPLQPDYWLSFDVIQSIHKPGVLLRVDAEHLREVKRNRPEINGQDTSPEEDETADIAGPLHDTDWDFARRRRAA